MRFGTGWSWLKILPLWIGIMSGTLAIVRETYGMFATNPVDPKSIFWECTRIAFILSAAIAWWQKDQAVKARDEVIKTLTAGPILQPHETAILKHVRDLLVGATEKELDLLKSLVVHGETYYEEIYRVHTRAVADSAAAKWQGKLITLRTEPPFSRTNWLIAPGLKDHLVQALYE